MNRLILIIVLFLLSAGKGNSYQQKKNWCRIEKGSVVVYCRQKDVDNGKRIVKLAERKYIEILQDFGINDKRVIRLYMASSEKEFNQITRGQLPEWSAAAAFPSAGIIYLKSPRFTNPDVDLEKTVIHELSHLVLRFAVGRENIMRWFDEGLAQYISGESGFGSTMFMARSIVTGRYLKLDEIDEVLEFRKSKASLAYRESYAAVSYLIEEWGRGVLPEIIASLKQSNNMDAALQSAIGIGLEEFEKQWLLTMKKRYRWAVIFDFRLLLSAAFSLLLLFAYIVKRHKVKLIKKEWEKEDFESFETY